MPIRGIDAQIMVTKTQDLASDQSRALNQHGNSAVQMAQDQKKQVERDQNRTIKLNKSEEQRVNVNEDNQKAKDQRKRKRRVSLLGFEYIDEADEEQADKASATATERRRFDISI